MKVLLLTCVRRPIFWSFARRAGFIWASAGKRIRCSDIEDLRRVYSKMRAWGFAPMLEVVS